METGALEIVDSHKMFGGSQQRFRHTSASLHCDMHCSVYLPPQCEEGPVPVLYWLSGLTCNDQNFVTKAGAQQYASQYGLAIVAPDTSPRGDGVADVDAWDMGQGAGFYLNASQSPWSDHYRMYDYIASELPALIADSFPVDHQRCGIFGHSMGGHGALVLALRNPQLYRSVSAFAPICAPSHCPWGQNAFNQYLGNDPASWANYDSCELIRTVGTELALLVDQGDGDDFLQQQLQPQRLRQACDAAGVQLNLRLQPGYDHSYYFIATFIGAHLAHHASQLGLAGRSPS